jgi:hypothetical protein
MPIAGGAGEAPVSNAWWRGWKRRPHRQHERTPAWSLYRRGHRPPASAIRADQDGADYPRRDRRAEIVERQRADRTTAQAPARCWSKARFGPLLALAKVPATGGSIGISLVSNALWDREQFHQNMLVGQAVPSSIAYQAVIRRRLATISSRMGSITRCWTTPSSTDSLCHPTLAAVGAAGYLANVGRKGVRRSMKERASGRTKIF